MEPSDDQLLFPEFPPVGREEWEALVLKDLKGADFEKKLVWKTGEGFQLQPFYISEDLAGLPWLENAPGRSPYLRGTRQEGNDWEIRQDILVDSPEEANRAALDALSKGAGSIAYIFPEKTTGFRDKEKVTRLLLKEIDFIKNPVHFTACPFAPDLPGMISGIAGERNINARGIKGSAGIDPLGEFCLTGKAPEELLEKMAGMLPVWKKQMPDYRFITVSPKHFRNAGSGLVQELAFGLSMGCEYLSFLSGKGLHALESAGCMQFDFATGSEYFLEIARIRAARYLWNRIVGAFDPEAAELHPMRIHCTTSGWNKTLYDPYVNMLRSTTEAMSAAIGGADSLTVEPFDAVYGKANPFSARMARNTQIILKEEAYMNKVADPAAGSYYVERLTASVIQAAWELFLQVEEQGGFTAAFRKGWIQERVEETAGEKIRNLVYRKDVLVGTNQYPLQDEKAGERVKNTPVKTKPPAEGSLPLLKTSRGAEIFENIRLRTEKNGNPPRVFLFTYGNLTMRRARAGFASGFFTCAGFEIIDHPGYASLEEGIGSCLESGAEITVICSSDEEYPGIVSGIAGKLKNKTLLVVAGYPKEILEQIREAGVSRFIHLRSDVAATLSEFQDALGMKA